jgi:hypothetical protein
MGLGRCQGRCMGMLEWKMLGHAGDASVFEAAFPVSSI